MVESHLPQKPKAGNADAKKAAKPDSKTTDSTNEDGDKMEVDVNSKETLDSLCAEDIREHAKLIEKTMITKETRFLNRVMRSLMALRPKLNTEVLQKAVNTCCQSDSQGLCNVKVCSIVYNQTLRVCLMF